MTCTGEMPSPRSAIPVTIKKTKRGRGREKKEGMPNRLAKPDYLIQAAARNQIGRNSKTMGNTRRKYRTVNNSIRTRSDFTTTITSSRHIDSIFSHERNCHIQGGLTLVSISNTNKTASQFHTCCRSSRACVQGPSWRLICEGQ